MGSISATAHGAQQCTKTCAAACPFTCVSIAAKGFDQFGQTCTAESAQSGATKTATDHSEATAYTRGCASGKTLAFGS
jgi:hypothetical protein